MHVPLLFKLRTMYLIKVLLFLIASISSAPPTAPEFSKKEPVSDYKLSIACLDPEFMSLAEKYLDANRSPRRNQGSVFSFLREGYSVPTRNRHAYTPNFCISSSFENLEAPPLASPVSTLSSTSMIDPEISLSSFSSDGNDNFNNSNWIPQVLLYPTHVDPTLAFMIPTTYYPYYPAVLVYPVHYLIPKSFNVHFGSPTDIVLFISSIMQLKEFSNLVHQKSLSFFKSSYVFIPSYVTPNLVQLRMNGSLAIKIVFEKSNFDSVLKILDQIASNHFVFNVIRIISLDFDHLNLFTLTIIFNDFVLNPIYRFDIHVRERFEPLMKYSLNFSDFFPWSDNI